MIYLVIAYRYGDIESHSYPVGVYPNEEIATEKGLLEESFRGRKYECRVYELQDVNCDLCYENIKEM